MNDFERKLRDGLGHELRSIEVDLRAWGNIQKRIGREPLRKAIMALIAIAAVAAFSWLAVPKVLGLFTVEVATEPPVEVKPAPEESGPEWIVAIRRSDAPSAGQFDMGDIVVLSSAKGKVVRVLVGAERNQGQLLGMSVSGDGKFLYYAYEPYPVRSRPVCIDGASIYRVPIAGGVKELIEDFSGSYPSVSPDGKKVALAVSYCEPKLKVLDLDTKQSKLWGPMPAEVNIGAVANTDVERIAWNADSTRLAFSRGYEGSFDIRLLDTAGHQSWDESARVDIPATPLAWNADRLIVSLSCCLEWEYTRIQTVDLNNGSTTTLFDAEWPAQIDVDRSGRYFLLTEPLGEYGAASAGSFQQRTGRGTITVWSEGTTREIAEGYIAAIWVPRS